MNRVRNIVFLLLFMPISLMSVAFCSQNAGPTYNTDDVVSALSSDDANVRLGAVATLREQGESAVPALAKAIKDPDANVKKAAIRALGRIGGKKAADALSTVLTDPDRNMRVWAIIALGGAGRVSYPYLLKALETEPFPRGRMFAAHSIGRIARAGDAPEILKRFDRQDLATQMHLAIVLVKIGDDEAYAGLNRLVESPNKLVRFYVVSAITEGAPNKKAFPVLVNSLDDEAAEVRMWGIYGLERLNLPETYPSALTALKDEDAYVRKEAAYMLGTLRNPAALPHLIACLKDQHYLVRANAAEALGLLGDAQAIPALKGLLTESEPAVQIKAAEALAQLKDYSGMETLIAMVDHPADIYKVEAWRSLQRISHKDFGMNRQAWADWWEQARPTFEGASEGSSAES